MSKPMQLTIRLLGEVAVARGGKRLMLPQSRKTRALLTYLATTGRAHRRDHLCSLLWDVPYDPRGALRTSLSKLRAVVDDASQRRVVAERDAVRFESADVEVDIVAIRRALAPDAGSVSTETLEWAAAAFRGEFAEGLNLSNCPEFHAWCVAEREDARRLHVQVLKTLIERFAAAPDLALPHARALVRVDSHAFAAHAMLLRLLIASGRRREAEDQFDLSIKVLAEAGASAARELGLMWRSLAEGSDDTDRFRNGRSPTGTAKPSTTPSAPANGAAMRAANAAASIEALMTPAELRQVEVAAEAERKHVTVLFASVSGLSLAAAHLDPEEIAHRLAPSMAAMKEAVHRYEGTVSHVFGDGLLALFGAPIAYQDHASRACHAALAMLAAQRALDPHGLDMRVGLDSGEVVVRYVAHDLSVTYEAVGLPVYTARELAACADGTGIHLTRRTCDLVQGAIEVRPLSTAHLAHVQPPMEICELLGASSVQGAWQARAVRRGLATFVGREMEMATLHRVLARARSGEGQAVVVTAEGGVGKSRLVHELLASGALEGWAIAQAAASSFDQNTPYFAVKQVLRGCFEIEDTADRAEISRKLEGGLSSYGLQDEEATAGLLALLDLPRTEAWDRLDAAVRRQRIVQSVYAIARHRSGQAPLLIVLEDLHWADKETLKTLDYLYERLPGMRVVLLATCRPERPVEWAAKSYYTGLRLLPLDAAAAESMVASLVGRDAALGPVRRLVIERTQGIPLFLEETIHALIETGVLQGKPGAYYVTRAIDHIVTPPTVQAALAERIDRLPLEQKGLLQIASVIGDDIPLSVLQLISEMAEDSLHRLLDALHAAELIYEAHPLPRRAFAFKHPLTREAAYQSLLVERRRQLHAEVLATMESLYGDQTLEHVERLAHHALQGARWEKAIAYAQQAADKAVEKSAYQVAGRFLESALDALSHLPQDRETIARSVDIRVRLRPVLTTIGDFSRSLDHLREAQQLAESIADQRRLARVMIQKSYIVGGQGLLDSGIEAAERACALAKSLDDEALRVGATLALAESLALRGDAQRVVDLVAPLISHLVGELRYERAGMFGTLSTRALGYLAVSHTHLGEFDKALACCGEALAIAREGQRAIDLAYCHYRLGLALLMKGDLPQGVENLEQALLHCREARFTWLTPRIAASLGYGYSLMGEKLRARPLLEEAIAQAKSINLLMSEAVATGSLAHSFAMTGDLDAATNHGQRALDLSRRYGYWQVETFSLRILGVVEVQRRRDGIGRAEAQLREALTLAEARGFRPQVAHCRLALGRMLLGAGRLDEARTHLETAATLYEAMGMNSWLPQVHSELVRCASPQSDG